MRALQRVMYGGWFFVQCHLEPPLHKSVLRDIEADLIDLPGEVRAAGHDRAFVAVRNSNLRMQRFVTDRGFSFVQNYGHLKIYQRHV